MYIGSTTVWLNSKGESVEPQDKVSQLEKLLREN